MPRHYPNTQTQFKAKAFALTDLGNAERLTAKHGQDLRYCHPWGKWLVWDGMRFRMDETGEAVRRAKAAVRSLYAEAATLENDAKRAALVKHARSSESKKRLQDMIVLAQSEPGIPVLPAELDRDPFNLNCLNGTLDLTTGTLHSHNRADLITKLVPVAYDPAAQCPTFLAFLARIMGDNQPLIDFIQRLVGYSLTGDVSEKALAILYGSGDNGKTTLVEAISDTLGEDYATRTPTETLLIKRDGAIPNDIARLRGARFVYATEAEEGKRLAEALVKELTGGDKISARFMRGEWFSFRSTFKLWLATNHKSVIRGTDHAIWKRIKLLPFTVRIPEAEQDKQLPAKLRAEARGIFAWAVQGCLVWQQDGLGVPEDVQQATAGYRGDMDVIGGFLADCCLVGHAYKTKTADLYKSYKDWCDQNGEHAVSQKMFGMRLAERGLKSIRLGPAQARGWEGVGLIAPPKTDSSEMQASEEVLSSPKTEETSPDALDTSRRDFQHKQHNPAYEGLFGENASTSVCASGGETPEDFLGAPRASFARPAQCPACGGADWRLGVTQWHCNTCDPVGVVGKD